MTPSQTPHEDAMSETPVIPDDIMRAAVVTYDHDACRADSGHLLVKGLSSSVIVTIARAIQAERNRCAAIAKKNVADWHAMNGNPCKTIVDRIISGESE
jgi:hypothetical protein